jgi:tetratricopeptide (TPR) repeat protein
LDQEFKDADAQFEKALDNFRHYRLVWLEADTYYDWGRVLISAGDQLRAGEKFDAAVEIYGQIGAAQRWIDRVEEARSAGYTVSQDRAQRERHGAEPSSTRAGVPKGSNVPTVSLATSCSFQREGDFWTISYRDHTFRLKDMKGLYYIAHLLAHPGEHFHVHDLVTVVDRAARADDTIPRDVELRVTNDLGDAGAILDPRAKAEYRSRRVELQGELAEAEGANDGGRAERIREELEMLEEQLAAAVGLGGRDRKAADHAERTRSRVGRAIRNSLRSIRENDPSLGHHLETCIHTGYLCTYRPGPEVSPAWRV